MSSFEVTILGASGGPDAGTTQSFMVRPFGCRDLRSICVDGGAGFGQILQMLARSGDSWRSQVLESFYVNDFEPADQFFDSEAQVSWGFADYMLARLERSSEACGKRNTFTKALDVYKGIKEYYVTHAHLDHIAAIVLNSPLAYSGANGDNKLLWGLPFTVDAIEKHVFNDLIWPDLLHCGSERLKPGYLTEGALHACGTFPQWDVVPFKVHHGASASTSHTRVYSTVYLLSDRATRESLLVCGDLEPDFTAGAEPLLEQVWRYIAANVPSGYLKGIIIECSSPTETPKDELYGHMSPAYLVSQLETLRAVQKEPDALSGLHVVITHVKKIVCERDPRLTILQELRDAADKVQLDVRFSMAAQGYTFSF